MTSPKQEAIFSAALDLFAERGYHGTAVPDIASKAGVGPATLYRLFDGKEALVNALYQRWKHQLALALLASLSGPLPPREAFSRFWHALGRFFAEHPTAYTFLELHAHGDYLDAKSKAIDFEILIPVQEILQSWQRQGAIGPVRSELLMSLVYGGFTGLVRAARKFGLSLDAEALCQTEACMWEALRAT
jgi:TetR/AcrR family transcriptional regulator, repressor of fatR-cypB operon